MTNSAQRPLRLRDLGIDSRNEHLAFMRSDCLVCKTEGFEALNRIRISHGEHSIVASLIVIDAAKGWLKSGEIGLSQGAIERLAMCNGSPVIVSHLEALDSMSDVRRKVYGNPLDAASFERIVQDLLTQRLSNIQVSAFVTACTKEGLNDSEVTALTRAMTHAGVCLSWEQDAIYDKHCIGGLPGNRTTPIVIAIAAAAGLTVPKTSSRAITSPAGTADTMETLTRVTLSLEEMKQVVEETGGCFVWGGNVCLSPADDIVIRVERALDIDSEGQLIASVLSKKAAAGSTHVLIDIPVGPTAKVRSAEAAETLVRKMVHVGQSIGLKVQTVISDGSQPVGRGIGPCLEALDVLAVLQGSPDAPSDLEERSLLLAGKLLEMGAMAQPGEGKAKARSILESGQAWEKFQQIFQAQGEFKTPTVAPHIHCVNATLSGRVLSIDNRKIAKVAKLAGAPEAPSAGVRLLVRVGTRVQQGQGLFEVHSEAIGELDYALEYLNANADMIKIEEGSA